MYGFEMSHYQQFYVQPQDVTSTGFTLRGPEFQHAVRVCRKRVGEWLVAVDGYGHRYQGAITVIESDRLQVSLQQLDSGFAEPQLSLTLAVALLKGSHFEQVVEQGTEVGVSCFQPLLTERTLVESSSHRWERWQEKARSAMKQCGRSVCPVIHQPMEFAEFLQTLPGRLCLIADAAAENSCDLTLNGAPVVVMIGPEGGFTDAEVAASLAQGAVPFFLGKRRLRSETAALVAAARILAAAGRYGE
ncbi:MAG TPA: RsmE family RNA methyltransferase [bacterium]|nr:RsmE family RNA methyltransferase [bacterium]HPN34637.1 RsmE family RNA methyltransferase [bacterium]